jgi:pimeloyl-ACP methyl ester carboxylesterase
MGSAREIIGVPVPGGDLAVEVISSGTEPVLAIHGISSQRKLWNWLRAAAPDLSLIAPDLRGRGDSAGIEGRSSIARHAADMVRQVPGVDHAASIMSQAGVRATADLIAQAQA